MNVIEKPSKTIYHCNGCGFSTSKWAGQCPNCKAWGSLATKAGLSNKSGALLIQNLEDVSEKGSIFMSSIPEFDSVCGAGIPQKGVILIVGEPGIGKSTLLLQICDAIKSDRPAVYITAEEAVDKIKLRAKRLDLSMKKIACASADCVENIIEALSAHDPSIVVIDSIQMVFSRDLERTPGSINQMRACAHLLIEWCNNSNSALIIVGHVTKEGSIAGPKVIEHMVDIVMHFEGERGGQPIRVIRTIKNRFGSTDVIGVFEIGEKGLNPMLDVSKAFISKRKEKVVGGATLASLDGNRVIMLEIQALISDAPMQTPKRIAVGWDATRMHTIVAILESKCRIFLGGKHVYCSVFGGLKITESAGDLPVAIAIISEVYNVPLSPCLVAFGEISPSGEIREVKNMQGRVAEAIKLGFDIIVVPASYNPSENDPRLFRFAKVIDVAKWVKEQGKA